jgi:hypothetical protein
MWTEAVVAYFGVYPRKCSGLRKYPRLSTESLKDAENYSTVMFVLNTLIALRYSNCVPVNAIKAYGAMEVYLHSVLASALYTF